MSSVNIHDIITDPSLFLEDVVLAFTIQWKECIKECGEYVPFRKYLENTVVHSSGLQQILAEYVLLKEYP